MGAVRARSAAGLVRRLDRAAGRRLPPDDPVHGAGRGKCARGCRDAVTLRRRDARRRRSIAWLRGDAARAYLTPAAYFAAKYLGPAQGRSGLGLRLRRMEGAERPFAATDAGRSTVVLVPQPRRP